MLWVLLFLNQNVKSTPGSRGKKGSMKGGMGGVVIRKESFTHPSCAHAGGHAHLSYCCLYLDDHLCLSTYMSTSATFYKGTCLVKKKKNTFSGH